MDILQNLIDCPTAFGRRIPQIGDVYKHFKGMKVLIENIATHTETSEILVIYRHNNEVWARPLEMFLSKVDKEKYPDVSQKYRLERDLPWGVKQSIVFKQWIDLLSSKQQFQEYTKEQLEEYILEHFYI